MSMNLRNAYIRESLLARLLKHLANIETYYKLTCSVSDSKARGPGFDPWSGHFVSPSAVRGWSDGAMVLGKLLVPGRPTLWMIVGQGPIAFAVGAGGVVWKFLLSSIFSLLFLSLMGDGPT